MKPAGADGSIDDSGRKTWAWLLAVTAVLLLGVAIASATAALTNSSTLGRSIERTNTLIEANIRTLTQTQRELMLLQMLIERGDPDKKFELRIELMDSRIQESSLSYQRQTLGTDALLQMARTLGHRWTTDLRPKVVAWHNAGDKTGPAADALIDELSEFEMAYNTLVADGEANRKLTSRKSREDATSLLAGTRNMVYIVLSTFAASLAAVAIGAIVFRRLLADRQAANRRLVAANTELREYEHVVQATSAMVLAIEPEGAIRWVNEAFEKFTGWSLDEIVGQRPGDVLGGPDTDQEDLEEVRRALAIGDHFDGELDYVTKSGQAFRAAISCSPLHDEDGSLTGYVVVQSDVTERHAAEQLLVQAREAAEAAAREKAAFLAVMSHEIRTPLNAVLGMTDLLRLTELNSEQREFTETAHRSGQHLLSLLNDILDFSALESGELTSDVHAFSLDQLVTDCLEMVRPAARSIGIALRVDRAPDMPSHIASDAVRIRQILVNILGNAVKFTNEGTVTLGVSLGEEGTVPGSRLLHMTVIDTGIGVSQERSESLFRPFVQADRSTTRRYGGTGLGLPISRGLARGLGGDITLRSTPGEGTQVDAWVSVIPADSTDGDESGVPRSSDLPPLRVLVAEDDPVNQVVIRAMLARIGIEPQIVGDGEEALAVLRTSTFDVILLDLQMPVLDGLETASAIAGLPAESRPYVAAVTADASHAAHSRIASDDFDDYLAKPVSLEALTQLLSRVPARTRTSSEAGSAQL